MSLWSLRFVSARPTPTHVAKSHCGPAKAYALGLYDLRRGGSEQRHTSWRCEETKKGSTTLPLTPSLSLWPPVPAWLSVLSA